MSSRRDGNPVAVTIPRRVVVVLEGESLVNDASGLVVKIRRGGGDDACFSLREASAESSAGGGGIVGGVCLRGSHAVHAAGRRFSSKC